MAFAVTVKTILLQNTRLQWAVSASKPYSEWLFKGILTKQAMNRDTRVMLPADHGEMAECVQKEITRSWKAGRRMNAGDTGLDVQIQCDLAEGFWNGVLPSRRMHAPHICYVALTMTTDL